MCIFGGEEKRIITHEQVGRYFTTVSDKWKAEKGCEYKLFFSTWNKIIITSIIILKSKYE